MNIHNQIRKLLFTSSNYSVFLISNLSFIAFYSFVLLQECQFYYFLSGTLCWSLWEYIYHRCIMHYTNTGKLYYFLHGHHHIYPDKHSIHIPLIQYFLMVYPIYFLLKCVFCLNYNQNISYTIGHLYGLFFFENMHKEVHQPYWNQDKDAGFRISHMYHHTKNKQKAFCFTSPVFDILFGTFPEDALSYNWFAFLPIPYFSYTWGTFVKKETTEKKETTSLLLGGAGSCFWYYAGKIQYHIEKNPHYIESFDKVFGVSVGSLLGCFVVSKCDLLVFKQKIIEITNEIKEKPFLIWGCLDIIRKFCQDHLPDNAYLLCSNKLHIQTFHLYSLSTICFHEFSSNDDLIDKIIKSCHIPFFCNGITNEGYIDRMFDTCNQTCCASTHIISIKNSNDNLHVNVWDFMKIANENKIKELFQKGYDYSLLLSENCKRD